MKIFRYTVLDEDGIHARPAGALVKEAKKFPCDITITKGDRTVDAKKLFALMSLVVKKDDTVVVEAEGEQEEQAIVALKAIFEENL